MMPSKCEVVHTSQSQAPRDGVGDGRTAPSAYKVSVQKMIVASPALAPKERRWVES